LVFKNENLNDAVVQILDAVQDEYVPKKKVQSNSETNVDIIEPILFGGDQLTEERARNGQAARADGDTDLEKLRGLVPKVEVWHAIRLLYQVQKFMYKMLQIFLCWYSTWYNHILPAYSTLLECYYL
jgi:hypothetical protein